MIALNLSCDPDKLKQVVRACKVTMKGFYGLTNEDKEEILLEVIWQFEKDAGKYPATVYGRYCVNKVLQYIEHNTAKKRKAQTTMDGTVVYIDDVSLNMLVQDGEDMTLEDVIPYHPKEFEEAEFYADVEKNCPDLLPIIKRVLEGEVLTRNERSRLKTQILNRLPLY